MANAPSSFNFALAVGAAGAYVDVTTDVLWDNSVTRSWGTQNQFQAISPGTYAFTLDDRTGNYTPDNAASTLATLLTEGTGVCWSLNGQLRGGKVRAIQPVFPDIGLPASARVRITVVDQLNDAGLYTVTTDLPDSINVTAGQQLMWTFSDPVGTAAAAQSTSGGVLGPMAALGINVAASSFGATQIPGLPGTAFAINATSSNPDQFAALPVAGATPIAYPQTNMGYWNIWAIPTANGTFDYGVTPVASTGGFDGVNQVFFGWDGAKYFLAAGTTAVVSYTPPATDLGVGHFLALSLTTTFSATWTVTATVTIDGVTRMTATYAQPSSITLLTSAQRQPARSILSAVASGVATSQVISRASHTLLPAHEELAIGTTEAVRLSAYAASQSALSLATLPTDLSIAPIGLPSNTMGQSLFDVLLSIINTEQGYLDTITTGTLTAPVQQIRVRARQRPVTVSASFGVAVDLTGSPVFLRALADEIGTDIVTGSNNSTQTVTNAAITARIGPANGTDTVLTYVPSDLYEWGSDRINRGTKRQVDITSITLDACGGSGSNLWPTLTSLNPGDRIHVTGLPSTQLGYSTWDGFLIGADENHMNKVQSVFTLYLAPCPPVTIIIDTDWIGNGSNATISTAMTTGTTSMVLAIADGISGFDTVTLNYYIQVENEVMKVTGATAVAGGAQTLTVVRGQNSTTAATHAIGVAPEIVDNPSDVAVSVLVAF